MTIIASRVEKNGSETPAAPTRLANGCIVSKTVHFGHVSQRRQDVMSSRVKASPS